MIREKDWESLKFGSVKIFASVAIDRGRSRNMSSFLKKKLLPIDHTYSNTINFKKSDATLFLLNPALNFKPSYYATRVHITKMVL